MRKIPPTMRAELAADPRMKVCALKNGMCEGRIEWDHVWIYAGRQINELWAIVALCHKHHYEKNGNMLILEAVHRVSLKLASPEDLKKYPRKPWAIIKRSLGL